MKQKHQHISSNKPLSTMFIEKYLLIEFAIINIGAILYFIIISMINHIKYKELISYYVIIFALLKVIYFLNYTFRRIPNEKSLTFYQLLYSLGFIIFIIILSFALDYTCLSDCKAGSFSGINNDTAFIHKFVEFVYFSTVTFATIGYGDIIPITLSSKFLVILEIAFSFIMVVFIISNLKNISQNENTKRK